MRGKAPYHKLFAPDGEQMGITTDKGMMSLSPRGAAALAEAGVKRVFIGDFHPKKTSSLFAVGVDGADPDVRRGDDVAIGHLAEDGSFDLRAVGKAQMSAAEMTHHKRGVAVSLRHAA
ncbi:MAG: PUA domain-containing protein [Thermoplasmatota archaeon]